MPRSCAPATSSSTTTSARRIIREGAAEAAARGGLTLIEDEGLVAENAGLTEWPVPLLGRFDPAFLDVPPEVIQLTMRVNQKYFVCQRRGRASSRNALRLRRQHRRVGRRRGDRRRQPQGPRRAALRRQFFWEQDLKVPLAEQAKKLEQIVFHEKLGTVADKVERVAKLARWLVEGTSLQRSGSRASDAGRAPSPRDDEAGRPRRTAARLAKADLVTDMVGEFPELQGVMGGYLRPRPGPDPTPSPTRSATITSRSGRATTCRPRR